jgi:capsular exopolysaccharide synthesis family protein
MSKFFKALEEAERDRALRSGGNDDVARREPSLPTASGRESAGAPPAAVELPEGVDDHLVSLVTPAAFEAEQYRALRHVVEQLHKATGLKVVAVSSPGAGDGKTLTAVNLAGALAQAPEARVLLVEADLRRPSLGRLLGLPDTGGPGLVRAILEPHLTLDQIVQSRPPFNLAVVCAGATPSNPYDLLKSSRLGKLLDEARQQYDYIVLDTPPLAPVQDCRVIARWVDGFVLVVAALRTPRRLIEEALTTLDRTKILGLVFNAEDRSTWSHYSAYYQGYYAPGQPSANGHRGGALRRVVSKVGDSVRYHRRPSGSADDGPHGGGA